MNRHISLVLVSACLTLLAAACADPEAAKRQYLESGDAFMVQEKVSEAILQYRNALRTDPNFGEARLRLAEAYEKDGNAPAAFREFVRAADLLPEDAAVQVRAATYLLMSRQFEDAAQRAEKALAIDPQNVDALILRANGKAGLNDLATAITDIEEAIAAQSGEMRLYVSLGAFRAVEGRQAEAEAAFQNALRVNPDSIEARLAFAHFYWMNGNAPEVERLLLEVHSVDSMHEMGNRMLANLYLSTRRADRAEAPLKLLAERSKSPAASLALADYYVLVKRLDDAVAVLQPLATAGEVTQLASLKLAQLERLRGRHADARRLVDGVLAATPNHGQALTLLSAWQLRDGDPQSALATARKGIEVNPASALAQFALAQALIETNQPAEATAALKEVIRLNSSIVSAHLMLARLQLAAGHLVEAVEFATEAKRRAPADPDVRLALARSLIAAGRPDEAEPEVRALLASQPAHAASHSVAGQLALVRGDRAGARAAFDRALARDPNSVEALEGLLALDVQAQRLAQAIARIDPRMSEHPENVELQFLAARTYTEAGDAAEAERALREVIRLDPHHLRAYVLLGRVYARQGRLDEAVAELDAAAAKRPSDVAAPTMAAIILQMQNRIGEARKRYEAILDSHPRAAIAANNLAWLYAEQGTENLAAALQLAQVAKAQLPDVAEVDDTLGWIYYKQDLPRLAIPPLEESVRKDSQNATYHVHLGLAYAKAGERSKAAATLRRALELNPGPDDAKLVRQVLATLPG